MAKMMLKFAVSLLTTLLVAAMPAHAQPSPGRGGGDRPSSGGSSGPSATRVPSPKAPKPTNRIEIIGVVKAIDLDAQRITIAYEAVDELGWPHGIMPFAVYKADLLKTVSVGQKVRFKLDGQQIAELSPY
jgi:Cu/Ag efflux protein CusF